MIASIYKQAAEVIAKKPFRLWGISLLEGILLIIATFLAGPVVGISIALSYLISTSMTMVFLHGFRGEEVYAHQLFECFRDGKTAKRVIGGMAWKDLWVFLWFLIPIVGPIIAIVKNYSYALTPYILMQEPDVRISQAIKVSQERTKGYKGKMFGAEILVGVLVGVAFLILRLFAKIPYIGVLFGIVNALLVICYIIFSPLFIGLVKAAFYEKIMNNQPTEIPEYTQEIE